MLIKSDNTFNLIQRSLDISGMNGKIIANNIANINTKGYKRKFVSFDEAMKSESSNLKLKQTNEKHKGQNSVSKGINIKTDESSSMRADGNNVDLDLEKVNQASNTLMYNSLVTQANSKINMMRTVISGGR